MTAVMETSRMNPTEIPTETAPGNATTEKRPSLFSLLPGSVLVYLWPALSRSWPRASLGRAITVAAFNTLCGFAWMTALGICSYAWVLESHNEIDLRLAAAGFFRAWAHDWERMHAGDLVAALVGLLAMLTAGYLLPFFVLLPFGTRPGRNKACTMFVARVVMLGTGLVHWWGAAICGVFLAYIKLGWRAPGYSDDYARTISPLLLTFSILTIWHLGVLLLAVRREYRGPGDFPEPHDPWCDDCGYTLLGVNPEGRCPECGRLIQDSLGPQVRPPTAWEQKPSLWNWRVIARQAWMIMRRARTLFFSMPTLTGQRAAQRWLMLSMAMLFCLGLTIVPALYIALDADWNSVAYCGSLAMALVWTVFGLMMVGIETTGIATFSKMRGQKVYLATASKVTCYASMLMFLWVILGGTQLVVLSYLGSQPHAIQKMLHVGLRGEQVAVAMSLAVAHIGGLIWYEMTVYRGIRAIQWANK